MRQPTILTLMFLGLLVLWQAVLWWVMPDVGMGGMAIIYIIWPLLALSALCLWFLLRTVTKGRTTYFVMAVTVMLVSTLALHPQDSPLSFSQKLRTVTYSFLAI